MVKKQLFPRAIGWLKYLILATSLTLLIVFGHHPAEGQPVLFRGISPVLAQTSVIDAPQLVREGRESYEKGQFSDAATYWEKAASVFANQGDQLSQARVLSYLSLAYQQLGQLEQAEKTITDSLNLLQIEKKGDTTEKLQIIGSALTTQGHVQLALGRSQEALKTWEQAGKTYNQLRDQEGITGSLINQAHAMQALGLYRRACQTLTEALKLDNQVCETSPQLNQSSQEKLDFLIKSIQKQPNSLIRVIGLRSLGDVLRVVGNLAESQEVLQQSLKIAKSLQPIPDTSATLLSLGNTQRVFYNRAQDLYDRKELIKDKERGKVKEEAYKALELYRTVAERSNSKTIQIEAQLNRLSLSLDFKKWLQKEKLDSEVEALQPQIQLQVNELLNKNSDIVNLPLSQTTIYTKLNFVKILMEFIGKNELLQTANQQAEAAVQQAKYLKDKRSEAYALGIFGGLYERKEGEIFKAQELTEKALVLAQSIQAWDISYQWQRQLGGIYQKQGNIQDAIAAYDVAVKNLELVRRDILSINPDIQFSFRENVAPVYREYLNLLLQSKQPGSDNLQKAIEVNGLLQLAELENYLQCASLNLVSLDKVKTPPAAVIYTVVLEETVEVIVSIPQQQPQSSNVPLKESETNEKQQLYYYNAPRRQVEEAVQQLRLVLQEPDNDDQLVQRHSKTLYNLLIRRAEKYLPESGTLVFVLDSLLQNVPMAVLHDGNKYLVQKYSIALTLGSQLPNPKPFRETKLNALLAGLSEKSPSFAKVQGQLDELSNVGREVIQIKQTVSGEELLNQRFTIQTFQDEINSSAFSVIHLATHGQFSSNPEETYILAYDDPIKVRQLDTLLRRQTQSSLNPVALLVLSACETAVGDKRAALGIAGVAVQAGARSTLASLWKVSDRSTSLLMHRFYQELTRDHKGMTKAEALRRAQEALLLQSKHPYYWAAFVLVGNWL